WCCYCEELARWSMDAYVGMSNRNILLLLQQANPWGRFEIFLDGSAIALGAEPKISSLRSKGALGSKIFPTV
ncbi:hypothetical protein BDFG_09348, partial [Blastomyces dermatitidis ATCC 26199]